MCTYYVRHLLCYRRTVSVVLYIQYIVVYCVVVPTIVELLARPTL